MSLQYRYFDTEESIMDFIDTQDVFRNEIHIINICWVDNKWVLWYNDFGFIKLDSYLQDEGP